MDLEKSFLKTFLGKFKGVSFNVEFWDGDEEFQPKILLLWDKVSLSYLHFETTYYLQGDLLKAILQIIG